MKRRLATAEFIDFAKESNPGSDSFRHVNKLIDAAENCANEDRQQENRKRNAAFLL
jgi:hypothetical protein